MKTKRETPSERRAAPSADRPRDRHSRERPHGTATQQPAPPTSTRQAKARAKARKAKAPKAIRTPWRERLLARLSAIDLHPRTLAAKVPFVVLVIASLGIGLGLTLWLSTDSAERSYELGNARERNHALAQQKEALEREVLQAQSAPALADSARNMGMIPSRDTAHLVQDPAGNWVVIGDARPAEGAAPPPLNTPLPDPTPAAVPPPPGFDQAEVPVRVERPPRPASAPAATVPGTPPANPEVLVRTPAIDPAHAPAGAPAPGLGPAPSPALGPPPGPVEEPVAPPPIDAPPPPGPQIP